jgi:hypothetical protein
MSVIDDLFETFNPRISMRFQGLLHTLMKGLTLLLFSSLFLPILRVAFRG